MGEEAVAIVDYIKENKLSDVFILAPFRNQEDVINHYLEDAKGQTRLKLGQVFCIFWEAGKEGE